MATWTAPPAPPPRSPGFAARVWNAAVVTLIYVLVGPPAGALVFLGLVAAWAGRSDPSGAFAMFAFTSLFGVPLSYAVGAAPAFVVGLGFALWQTLVGRSGWLAAAAVGVVTGLLLAGANGEIGADVGAGVGADEDMPLRPIFMLTCVAATLAGWACTRSFVTAGARR